MTTCHLVVMEINKGFFILFVFISSFILYSQQCYDMKNLNRDPTSPIAELSFIPEDNIFSTDEVFNIICIAKKSKEGDNEYSYPTSILIYMNETVDEDLCPIADKDTRPVKTCTMKFNTTKPDTLSVSCLVENNYDCSYHKETIYIKEKEKPYLTQQPPRHINATEGQDINITCTSRVIPRPLITWYKNNVIISKQKTTFYRGTSMLMLKTIDSTSQGMYICKATNPLGEVSSNGSLLTVFSRPRISLGPVNQTVAMGNRVSMVCNVTGLPIPVIGWLKDGIVLGSGNGSDDKNLTGSRMSVTNVVSKPDIMTFGALSITPRADYTRNSTDNDVTRNTSPSLSPTTIFSRPIPPLTSTFTGTTPQLTNAITQTMPPSTSTFTRSIPPSTSSFTRSIPPSTSSFTRSIPLSTSATRPIPSNQRPFPGKMTQIGRQSALVIESVTKDDEGKYKCYAKNAIGNATSRHATLLVYIPEKPRFLVSPSNVSVLAGLNSTMTCAAVGNPRPNITWYKNKLPIIVGRRVSVVTNGNISALMVTYVKQEDKGKYTCKAENSFGTKYSEQAFLDVTEVFQPNVFSSSSGISPLIPALGILLPILLVIMVILLILITKKRRKLHQSQNTTLSLSTSTSSLAQKNIKNVGIRNEAMNVEEFQDEAMYLLLMGINRDWEIPRDRLRITNQRLGDGCFGLVDKGIYTRKDNKEMFVAVKTLKNPCTHTHRDDILAELDMLKRVGRHPNIVSLVGACTLDDPICIISELVEGGSLNDLLIKARLPANREKSYENIRSRLTERDLVKMAADITRGMKHLHDRNCIHRDLAARNILIGPGLVAKIADFGLARHVIDGFYVKQSPGKVPWKWMAPEALQGLFTTKTDVWSFGILLWEIATLGDSPYADITQLVVLYNLLSNGYRMPKPHHCHEMLYSVMMECWSADSNKRPAFGDIYKILQKMLNEKERIYINLEEMDQEEHHL